MVLSLLLNQIKTALSRIRHTCICKKCSCPFFAKKKNTKAQKAKWSKWIADMGIFWPHHIFFFVHFCNFLAQTSALPCVLRCANLKHSFFKYSSWETPRVAALDRMHVLVTNQTHSFPGVELAVQRTTRSLLVSRWSYMKTWPPTDHTLIY